MNCSNSTNINSTNINSSINESIQYTIDEREKKVIEMVTEIEEINKKLSEPYRIKIPENVQVPVYIDLYFGSRENAILLGQVKIDNYKQNGNLIIYTKNNDTLLNVKYENEEIGEIYIEKNIFSKYLSDQSIDKNFYTLNHEYNRRDESYVNNKWFNIGNFIGFLLEPDILNEDNNNILSSGLVNYNSYFSNSEKTWFLRLSYKNKTTMNNDGIIIPTTSDKTKNYRYCIAPIECNSIYKTNLSDSTFIEQINNYNGQQSYINMYVGSKEKAYLINQVEIITHSNGELKDNKGTLISYNKDGNTVSNIQVWDRLLNDFGLHILKYLLEPGVKWFGTEINRVCGSDSSDNTGWDDEHSIGWDDEHSIGWDDEHLIGWDDVGGGAENKDCEWMFEEHYPSLEYCEANDDSCTNTLDPMMEHKRKEKYCIYYPKTKVTGDNFVDNIFKNNEKTWFIRLSNEKLDIPDIPNNVNPFTCIPPINHYKSLENGYYRYYPCKPNSLTNYDDEGISSCIAKEGYYKDGEDIISCPNGASTSNIGATSISDCIAPLNFYNDGTNVVSCPNGSITEKIGATHISNCIASKDYYKKNNNEYVHCPNGASTINTGSTSISDCIAPLNFYNDGTNIVSCPNGSITEQIGVTHISDCIANIGFYKKYNNEYVHCPHGSSTVNTGSTSISDCIASLNYYKVGNKVLRCPIHSNTFITGSTDISNCIASKGYYNDGNNIYMCPKGTSSNISGSTYSDCIADEGFEKIGYYIIPSNIENTIKEKLRSNKYIENNLFKGYYINNYEYENCPIGKTSIPGATNCDITCDFTKENKCYCPSGYNFDVYSKECTECPKGKYNDKIYGKCLTCPEGKFSDNKGSKKCIECENQGSVADDGIVCNKAAIGYYRINNTYEKCPTGKTTLGIGSKSKNDCITEGGIYSNAGIRTICEKGFYCLNNEKKMCPSGTTTYNKGSKSIYECISTNPGYMGTVKPIICPIDMYCKGGLDVFNCPVNTSSNIGSTNINDCISNKKGYYGIGEAKICPIGSYCLGDGKKIQCPDNSNSNISSISFSDCKASIDYYNDGSNIIACPDKTSTYGKKGSISISNCMSTYKVQYDIIKENKYIWKSYPSQFCSLRDSYIYASSNSLSDCKQLCIDYSGFNCNAFSYTGNLNSKNCTLYKNCRGMGPDSDYNSEMIVSINDNEDDMSQEECRAFAQEYSWIFDHDEKSMNFVSDPQIGLEESPSGCFLHGKKVYWKTENDAKANCNSSTPCIKIKRDDKGNVIVSEIDNKIQYNIIRDSKIIGKNNAMSKDECETFAEQYSWIFDHDEESMNWNKDNESAGCILNESENKIYWNSKMNSEVNCMHNNKPCIQIIR